MSADLRVKICGLKKAEQARVIVELGADALGFICVSQSPRYAAPEQIQQVIAALPTHTRRGQPLATLGVFADASLAEIMATVQAAGLTGVQLHGQESVDFCQTLRNAMPGVELIKALRIRDRHALTTALDYEQVVDGLLLDAFTAQALGGTGHTWDWSLVHQFQPKCPWFLAGGLTVDNVIEAVETLNPPGIDLSSGVELAPGDKDLQRVWQLFHTLEQWQARH